MLPLRDIIENSNGRLELGKEVNAAKSSRGLGVLKASALQVFSDYRESSPNIRAVKRDFALPQGSSHSREGKSFSSSIVAHNDYPFIETPSSTKALIKPVPLPRPEEITLADYGSLSGPSGIVKRSSLPIEIPKVSKQGSFSIKPVGIFED